MNEITDSHAEVAIHSRYLIDLIQPNVEAAINAHDVDDQPTWMSGMFVMPTPDGQAAMNGYLSISVASPVIGAMRPTATAILDPNALLDWNECNRLVADLMARAREMRSQMIDDARKDFEFDFSKLAK